MDGSSTVSRERARLLRTSALVTSLGSLLLSLVAVAGCRFLRILPLGPSYSATQAGLFEYEHRTGRCLRYSREYVWDMGGALRAGRAFAVLAVLVGGFGALRAGHAVYFLRTRSARTWRWCRAALGMAALLQASTLCAFGAEACRQLDGAECRAGPGAVASVFASLLWALACGLACWAPPPEGPVYVVRLASSDCGEERRTAADDDNGRGKVTPPVSPQDGDLSGLRIDTFENEEGGDDIEVRRMTTDRSVNSEEDAPPPPPPPPHPAPAPVLAGDGTTVVVPDGNSPARAQAQSHLGGGGGGGGGSGGGNGGLRGSLQRAASKSRRMVNPDGSVTVTERVEGGTVRVTTPNAAMPAGPTNERGELLLEEARRISRMVNPNGSVTEGDAVVFDPKGGLSGNRSAVVVAVSEEEEEGEGGGQIGSPDSVEASLLTYETAAGPVETLVYSVIDESTAVDQSLYEL